MRVPFTAPVVTVADWRELLETTSTPDLVRAVRPLAVAVRNCPSRYRPAEVALVGELARVRLNDPGPPPMPASAVGALVVALRRESPHLEAADAEHLAAVLVDEAARARTAPTA